MSAVRYTCDAGRTVKDGVLDSPTVWTVSCDAGGAFSAAHPCRPVRCTTPSWRGLVRYDRNAWLSKRFQRGRQSSRRLITPCCLRDGKRNSQGQHHFHKRVQRVVSFRAVSCEIQAVKHDAAAPLDKMRSTSYGASGLRSYKSEPCALVVFGTPAMTAGLSGALTQGRRVCVERSSKSFK